MFEKLSLSLVVLMVTCASQSSGNTFFTGEPHNLATLAMTAPGQYSFIENHDWFTENGGVEATIGSWSTHAWSYTDAVHNPSYPNALNLRNSPRGSIDYKIVIPVGAAQLSAVTLSASVRKGVTVRVRSTESDTFYDNLLISSGDAWSDINQAIAIPANKLDKSVAGQVSFFVRIQNEASSGPGLLDVLKVQATAAIPEPASLSLVGVGALLAWRRR